MLGTETELFSLQGEGFTTISAHLLGSLFKVLHGLYTIFLPNFSVLRRAGLGLCYCKTVLRASIARSYLLLFEHYPTSSRTIHVGPLTSLSFLLTKHASLT